MNKMKKSLVAAGLTAGLLGGGAAGAILGSAGVSGAQDATTTTVVQDDSGTAAERQGPEAHFAEALKPLVDARDHHPGPGRRGGQGPGRCRPAGGWPRWPRW